MLLAVLAVIVVVPTALAVTTPFAVTAATLVLLEVHVTDWLALSGETLAVRVTVSPTLQELAEAVIVTLVASTAFTDSVSLR